MAWQPPQEEDEGKFSKFNEAWLKMKRIDKLQDTINGCIINPTEFNLQYNCFNYEIVLRCCSSIIAECWAKLNEETRTDALKFKRAVETSIRKYPVHNQTKDINNGKTMLKYDSKVWEIMSEWLFKYNLKCRDYLGQSGYDSPDMDYDDDGL